MEERGSGWILFSAVILVMAGIMRIIDAFWAWRYDGPLNRGLQDAVAGESLTRYGWFWFIVGIILILAGIAVMQASEVGRWIGIIAAAIGAFSAMAWMPYYPIWSFMYVLIALMVIYGLAAYGGREMERT